MIKQRLVTKRQSLGQNYFVFFLTFIYYSHVQIYNRTHMTGNLTNVINVTKHFHNTFIYEYIKGHILERNAVHKQCVKASACDSILRKRLCKSHEDKVITQINTINVDNVLMFCTFWYLYSRLNSLVCNQSIKAFIYLHSL